MANQVLKEYLIKGYSINKSRLEYLEKVATLFIYILFFYNLLYKEDKQVIDNNTLVALTLLIAESNPKEKEILIDVIMNFLNTNKNSKII